MTKKNFNACAKYCVNINEQDIEPVYIFLRQGGTNKFRLVKVIYNIIIATLLCHFKVPNNPRVSFTSPHWNISCK